MVEKIILCVDNSELLINLGYLNSVCEVTTQFIVLIFFFLLMHKSKT